MAGGLEIFGGFHPSHVGILRVLRAPEEGPDVVKSLGDSGLDLGNGIRLREDFEGEGVVADVEGGVLVGVPHVTEYLSGAGVVVGGHEHANLHDAVESWNQIINKV